MNLSRLRAATVTAAITSLTATGLTVGVTTADASPTQLDPSAQLRKEVSVDRIMNHLNEFQDIADENGGTRASGTPG